MLAVTGGTVVTPDGTRQADVLIRHGTIIALAGAGAAPAGAERLDATGCFVLPGGVDPHCHLMADVAAATRAAALGGTTTVLSFTNPGPGEGTVACLLRCREELAAARAAVNVGLHAMLYRPDHVVPADLQALRGAGVGGIKVFLAYPELGIMWSTRGLFELMTAAARQGQVVQVHCEDGQLIEGLAAAAIAGGRTGAALFAETRPPEAEAASVALVLSAAAITGTTCYLVHLSCSQAIDQVRLARERRSPAVYGEVCLHHLLLDDRCYGRPVTSKRCGRHSRTGPSTRWAPTTARNARGPPESSARTAGATATGSRASGRASRCSCRTAWPGACRSSGSRR
jgi:dihydropyrimidinase